MHQQQHVCAGKFQLPSWHQKGATTKYQSGLSISIGCRTSTGVSRRHQKAAATNKCNTCRLAGSNFAIDSKGLAQTASSTPQQQVAAILNLRTYEKNYSRTFGK